MKKIMLTNLKLFFWRETLKIFYGLMKF